MEAAHREGVGLAVCECPDIEGNGDREPEGGESWEERVPLLSETIRFATGVEGRGWAGRSVSCRRVAERWFVFEEGG